MLTVSRMRELLQAFTGLRLVVVGDLMLDRYLHGVADRISPEAPVPVVRVRREVSVPGGAANVAANVAALGARVGLVGIRGDDPEGAELAGLLGGLGIEGGGVLSLPRHATIVKTRVVADRQQVVRVDREELLTLDRHEHRMFLDVIRQAVAGADGVILEDYGKGTLTQDVVDTVLETVGGKGIPVGFDPKDNHELCMDGIALATPNWREALSAAGWNGRSRDSDELTVEWLDQIADRLLEKWSPGLLIMTLGSQGMYLAPRKGPRRRIPTRAREVFDVSGAGDTVIATCLLALAAGATDVEAAEIGNHAAGIVVGKLGTAFCSPAELAGSIAGREVGAA